MSLFFVTDSKTGIAFSFQAPEVPFLGYPSLPKSRQQAAPVASRRPGDQGDITWRQAHPTQAQIGLRPPATL